jgi:hypothetical protein
VNQCIFLIYGLSLLMVIGGAITSWTEQPVPQANLIVVGILGILIGIVLRNIEARISQLEKTDGREKQV